MAGLEPATLGLEVPRAIQLRYTSLIVLYSMCCLQNSGIEPVGIGFSQSQCHIELLYVDK